MKFRIENLVTFKEVIKELASGLLRLSFNDNFESFETTVTISATSEIAIPNQLTFIPSKYMIVSQTGAGQVTKGTTTWNNDRVYLYNNGGTSVSITVIFLR